MYCISSIFGCIWNILILIDGHSNKQWHNCNKARKKRHFYFIVRHHIHTRTHTRIYRLLIVDGNLILLNMFTNYKYENSIAFEVIRSKCFDLGRIQFGLCKRFFLSHFVPALLEFRERIVRTHAHIDSLEEMMCTSNTANKCAWQQPYALCSMLYVY